MIKIICFLSFLTPVMLNASSRIDLDTHWTPAEVTRRIIISFDGVIIPEEDLKIFLNTRFLVIGGGREERFLSLRDSKFSVDVNTSSPDDFTISRLPELNPDLHLLSPSSISVMSHYPPEFKAGFGIVLAVNQQLLFITSFVQLEHYVKFLRTDGLIVYRSECTNKRSVLVQQICDLTRSQSGEEAMQIFAQTMRCVHKDLGLDVTNIQIIKAEPFEDEKRYCLQVISQKR